MPSQRVTITIPTEVALRLKERARVTGRPVSQLVSEAIKAHERERAQERIAEEYRMAAREAETLRVTADLEQLDSEDWPD